MRARRKHLGLTQDEAAQLRGLAVRTVRAVEAGYVTERLDALLAILTALGLQLHLVGGNDPGALVADRP